MTYFRNKFDPEFLALCNKQEKGNTIPVSLATNDDFWVFRRRNGKHQPNTIQVLPLVMCNRLYSSNKDDLNVENRMLICHNRSDTKVWCEWDDVETNEEGQRFICTLGIRTITGDLLGKQKKD